MNQLGGLFISAGNGTILMFLFAAGAFIMWRLYRMNPGFSRATAWLLMSAGIILAGFSFSAGVYFAILGAILLAICDNKE